MQQRRNLLAEQTDQTTLHKQDGQHEHCTDDVLPYINQSAGGQVVLAQVDEKRADDRTDDGASSADSDPDHHGDGVRDRHLRRCDRAVKVDEHRACHSRHDGRKHIREGLVVADLIAGEIGAVFTVADSDKQLAELARGEKTAECVGEHHQQQRTVEQQEHVAAVFLAADAAEHGLDFRDADIAVRVRRQRDKNGVCCPGQSLRNDGEIHALNAVFEDKIADQAGNDSRHDKQHNDRTRKGLERLPDHRQLGQSADMHEIRDAAAGRLQFQVHRHRIAAEGEIQAVAERQNAGIAPDEVKSHGHNGKGNALAEVQDGRACRQHAALQQHRHGR